MNQRVIAIGVAAAVFILALWYFFLWSPQGGRIEDAKDRRSQAEQLENELRSRLQRLQDQKRNEAATRSQIEILRVAIPDQPNLAQFILDANDAATRSGIDFLSVAPTPPAAPSIAEGETNAPAQIQLALTITGGYFQVIDFVNRLNELPRLVMIDSVNVTASGDIGLSVGIQARMFVSSVPAGSSAPSATAPAGGAATTTTVAGGATTTTSATVTTVAP